METTVVQVLGLVDIIFEEEEEVLAPQEQMELVLSPVMVERGQIIRVILEPLMEIMEYLVEEELVGMTVEGVLLVQEEAEEEELGQ